MPITEHHQRRPDAGDQLVVSVREDGVYVETDRLSGARLLARLRQELKLTSRPVHVRADRALAFGRVRQVLEEVHAAGAVTVGLGTEEKR